MIQLKIDCLKPNSSRKGDSVIRKLDSKLIFAIIATGLMSFSGVVIETATNVTFPVLMSTFHVSTAMVQWMTTGYLLVAAIVMPLSAFFKNNFPSKHLFITAASLFILGLLIDIYAPNFLLLVLGRICQGIGTGIALPLMFNIILEQAPVEKIGLLMGIGMLITAIAPALGPTFGGLVVNTLGWRNIFVFILPLVIMALLLGAWAIRQGTPLKPSPLDKTGLFFIALTFIGLISACGNLSKLTKAPLSFIIPLVIGSIGLLLSGRHSLRVAHPLLSLRILNNRKFTQHLIAFFLLQLAVLGISFILPNYIQLVNHQTALLAGLIVLPGAALGALFAPLSGSLFDKFGARQPILAGIVVELLALLLFVLFARSLSNLLIGFFYLLFMCGLSLVMGNTMTNGLTAIPAAQKPDGNALFNTLQQFAGAVGTALVSAIMQLSQNANFPASYAARTALGAQYSFSLLLLLIVLAAVLLVLGTRKRITT